MMLLVICITLIVYFLVIGKAKNQKLDVAPHEWYITRDMWLAPKFNTSVRMDYYEPVHLVIISHTAGAECDLFINCAAELRNLQNWYKRDRGYDIPYNFMIGNEGRVYEARGWGVVGAHTEHYNDCGIDVAFMGDYREGLPSYSHVQEIQLERLKMLLEEGVKLGHLHPQYQLLGARDLRPTISPGERLYNAIQQWDRYAHENLFANRSCHQIRELFENETTTTVQPTTTVEPTTTDKQTTKDEPTTTDEPNMTDEPQDEV